MNKNAFTLVEIMIAIILVGLTITALLAANIAFSKANSAGANLSTAEFLIDQIRECTAMLPAIDPQSGVTTFGPEEASVTQYDDIDDFDEAEFSPPIDITGNSLTAFPAFSQKVTVQNVSTLNFEQVVADHSSNFVRVTVEVFLNSGKISSASWIRTRRD